MPVDGVPLDAGALGDRADGRAHRPDRAVQLERRLGDPSACVGHLRGPLLQLVLSLRSLSIHCCATNLDRTVRTVLASWPFHSTEMCNERRNAMLTVDTTKLELTKVWWESAPNQS